MVLVVRAQGGRNALYQRVRGLPTQQEPPADCSTHLGDVEGVKALLRLAHRFSWPLP